MEALQVFQEILKTRVLLRNDQIANEIMMLELGEKKINSKLKVI